MKGFPKVIKSGNPRRWQNIAWAKDQQDEQHTISLSNGVGWYRCILFSTAEADGLSVDNYRDLGAALELAQAWIRRTMSIRAPQRGTRLEHDEPETGADYVLYKFPMFLRDKDRAIIYCKIYTDHTHGGSVVIWHDYANISDLASVGQVKTMVERVADFATAERVKYTVR